MDIITDKLQYNVKFQTYYGGQLSIKLHIRNSPKDGKTFKPN